MIGPTAAARPVTSAERTALAVVLGVAACTRLYDLSLMEFRHDAAYWAVEGQRILGGGYWPLVGQQVGSVRVPLPNGPFLSYLTAIVMLVAGPDPRTAAAVIAAANVAGVWLTYRLGHRLYGSAVALTAAALSAIAPWLVLYGRMLWPQSLFPFLIPLVLLTWWHALESGRTRWFLASGVLLGIGAQLHLSILPFIATMLIFTLAWQSFLAALRVAGGCMLGYAPIVLYDATHGFAVVRAVATLPTLHVASDPLTQHAAKTLWNFSNVLSGQGLWVSKLAHHQLYLPSWIDWAQGLLLSVALLVAAIVIVRWSRRARSPHLTAGRTDAALLAFVFVPALYLLLARSQIHRHYFIVLYPLPFLLIARGIQLATMHARGLALGMRCAVAVGVMLNLATLVFAYRFLQERGGEGEYGTVFADKVAAVDFDAQHNPTAAGIALTEVQEPLPYSFLFFSRHGRDVESAAAAVSSRIVEGAYHPLALRPGECVNFQRRGVAVIGRCNQ